MDAGVFEGEVANLTSAWVVYVVSHTALNCRSIDLIDSFLLFID